MRLLLKEPIAVNASQTVSGSLKFVASSKVSYVITMTLYLDGTHITSSCKVNLADQMYHYLTPAGGAGTGHAAYGGSHEASNESWEGYDQAAAPPPPGKH